MGVIFKNNVMYGAGDIEISPICYSEEEREIGVWTDGKPLYQRTLFYTGDTIITVSANSSSTYSVTGITDVYANDILPTLDRLIHYQIDLTFDGNEKNIYHFEYCFQASTGTFMRSHNPGIAYIGYNIIPGSSITLQYTKTIDTPGSGIWTPSGIPAVHYSTDEQVIGTWVDGKTLYEKTLYVASGQIYSSTGISMPTQNNIDRLVSYTGSVYDSNDQRMYALPYERMIANEGIWVMCHVLSDHSLTPVVFTRQSSTYNLSDIYVTIRYTKSTS